MSVIKIRAANRDDCTNCGDCFQVCPEPHIIAPSLFPKQKKDTSLITNSDCLNCGKCIDICDEDVFKFSHRFKP